VPVTGVQGSQFDFVPDSASRVELQGTTNISSWSSKSSDIHGSVVLDTNAAELSALFNRIQFAAPDDANPINPDLLKISFRSPVIAEISVPILSLHGDSAGMDRDMQNALKAAQHPAIEYTFQQVQQASLQWDSPDHPPGLNLSVVGKLSVAGVWRTITMDVIVKRDSRGHFIARAQTTILMTDFGVTPPVALLGLIKAADKVDVIFDLDLVRADQSSGMQETQK
jgi:polyisoprenoid-binding protein YceI